MENSNELILIQHGFMGAGSNYKPMISYFTEQGYDIIFHKIKTGGKPLEKIYNEFESFTNEIDFTKYNKVHWIGHSLGCILTRIYLSKYNIDNIKTLILISGPNSNLNFKPTLFYKAIKSINFFRPLVDLLDVYDKIDNILNNKINIGVIAGKGILPISKSVDEDNDGLISVSMTIPKNEKIKDFVTFNYNHYEIYQKEDVIKSIHNFILYKNFLD